MKESNADAVSEDNITRITTLFTAEHREECCFSCTVLSNKSDTLSFTYGERDVFEEYPLSETLAYILYVK